MRFQQFSLLNNLIYNEITIFSSILLNHFALDVLIFDDISYCNLILVEKTKREGYIRTVSSGEIGFSNDILAC